MRFAPQLSFNRLDGFPSTHGHSIPCGLFDGQLVPITWGFSEVLCWRCSFHAPQARAFYTALWAFSKTQFRVMRPNISIVSRVRQSQTAFTTDTSHALFSTPCHWHCSLRLETSPFPTLQIYQMLGIDTNSPCSLQS